MTAQLSKRAPNRASLAERNLAIAAAWGAGRTMIAIGREFGLSRQRVHTILAEHKRRLEVQEPLLAPPGRQPVPAPAAAPALAVSAPLAVPAGTVAAREGAPITRIMPASHAIRVKKSMCMPVVDYDKPGDDDESDPFAEADFRLGQLVYRALQNWYPDQRWQVKVTHAGGIVAITLPILMKRNLYQIVHISSLAADPGMKCIMRAAGECLERVGLPRQGFSLDRFLEARARGPYGRKPPSKLIVPDFATSARPRAPIEAPLGAVGAAA